MGAMMKRLTKRYCSASEGDAISQYDTRLLTTSCSSCTPDCASEHKSSKACCSHWPAADIAIVSRPPFFQIIFQFLPSPPPNPASFLSLSLPLHLKLVEAPFSHVIICINSTNRKLICVSHQSRIHDYGQQTSRWNFLPLAPVLFHNLSVKFWPDFQHTRRQNTLQNIADNMSDRPYSTTRWILLLVLPLSSS